MSNGFDDVKVNSTFKTAETEAGRKAGELKTTHGTFDFSGVTREQLIDLAVKQATIRYQGRMRKRWGEHKDGEKATIKVADLFQRAVPTRAITKDDVAAYLAGLSPAERKKLLGQ